MSDNVVPLSPEQRQALMQALEARSEAQEVLKTTTAQLNNLCLMAAGPDWGLRRNERGELELYVEEKGPAPEESEEDPQEGD